MSSLSRSSSVAVCLLLACGVPEGAADDSTAAVSGEVRVHPQGGSGTFELKGPSFQWQADGGQLFAGAYTFGNAPLAINGKVEKTQNTYTLSSGTGFDSLGRPLLGQSISVRVDAGTPSVVTLGGLQVRFDRPLDFGVGQVNISGDTISSTSWRMNQPWAASSEGARALAIPESRGALWVSTLNASQPFVVSANAVTDIVLPTASFEVSTEAYDPSYPDPGNCYSAPFLRYYDGVLGDTSSAYLLRTSSGAVPSRPLITPSGPASQIYLSVLDGFTVFITSQGPNRVSLHRLEVDDVEVVAANGSSSLVRGSWVVSKKQPNGTWSRVNCSMSTHTGIDVLDGTYLVQTTANTATGSVVHSQEVTF